MGVDEPDLSTVFPDVELKVSQELAGGFNFTIWHYFSRIADKTGYIDDYEYPARVMVKYNISKDTALTIYKAWKKCYLEAVAERKERC